MDSELSTRVTTVGRSPGPGDADRALYAAKHGGRDQVHPRPLDA